MTPPLEEAFYESERARLQRWVPWLHLMRGFRLATRWQNLALALLGVLLLAGGRRCLSHLPFADAARTEARVRVRSDASGPRAGIHSLGARQPAWPWERNFVTPPLPSVDQGLSLRGIRSALVTLPLSLLTPITEVIGPGSVLFERRAPWTRLADAWLQLLLVLSIGALAGGAITRRVGMEFTGRGEIGFGEALHGSVKGFPVVLGAPFIAAVGIALLLLLGRVLAWIGRIPGVGEPIAALFWGGLLLLALVMAFVLLALATGWPLMVAAHSVERTDGFDALNRACNYVFVRPWYALWMLVVTLVYGAVLMLFLLAVVGLTLHLTNWMAAGPISDGGLTRIVGLAPEIVSSHLSPEGGGGLVSRLGGFWYYGLASLLTAYLYSYFWTMATLIYFLLRRSVDATDLDRIAIPKRRRPADGPPLAGIAAVQQREQAVQSAAAAPASSPVEPPPASPPEAAEGAS